MTDFVFPALSASVPIVGSAQRFPVHRIYCVGRNYADHAREMGANPEREAPFFFCKPADAVTENHAILSFPSRTKDLHHEIELVVAIGASGKEVSLAEANKLVYGYAVGLDLTRRDLQAEAKQKNRPWDTAKGFDQSAPITAITPRDVCGELSQGEIFLRVNGEIKQTGNIKDLIWSIPEIIAELSTLFTLMPGDLIFTGTPAGVGAIHAGDTLIGGVSRLPELEISFID